ncbi:MAG: histidine utilization repressor [Desulfobacterales bacterium]|nr:histidine utilization repressor [Desulfobacterales bacterium]
MFIVRQIEKIQPKRLQPLYIKIKTFIVDKIDRGEWQIGAKISSEAELVTHFGTSRMTVNRAVRELTAEGRLIRKQGQGTYVAALKPQSAFLEITSIAEEIKRNGGNYSCKVHLLTDEKANPELAADMQLKPYASVFHSVLVHKDTDIPIQLADRYINPALAPDYLKQDFSTISPTEYLLQLAPVYRAEHTVEALIPDAWIRELLEINESEPCLALFRKTWVGGKVATRSCFYYPGSRYSLGGRFTPSASDNTEIY